MVDILVLDCMMTTCKSLSCLYTITSFLQTGHLCTNPAVAHAKDSSVIGQRHGDNYMIECEDGYRLEDEDSDQMICSVSGEWQDAPQCVGRLT